jgi:hypothetical protein
MYCIPTYSQIFHEKQLDAGRRSESEEIRQQADILFATMGNLKKKKRMKRREGNRSVYKMEWRNR